MLAADELSAALASLAGEPLEGVLYRAIFLEALFGFHQRPAYPQPQPLYSLGAPSRGARFTPRGGMATLYMAEDQETALAEAHRVSDTLRRARSSAGEPHRPTVLVSAVVRLTSVVDLAATSAQAAWAQIRRNSSPPGAEHNGEGRCPPHYWARPSSPAAGLRRFGLCLPSLTAIAASRSFPTDSGRPRL